VAWIESHQEIGRHPKTKRLARMLGVSLPTAIGHLQLLWWWALDFAPDGSLTTFDDGDIADAMLWEGDPATLVSALSSAGWLDSDRGIHDWYDYAGKLVERRRMEAERLRQYRKANRHVQHTPEQRTPYERSTLVVTVPDSTVPDSTSPLSVVSPPAENGTSVPATAKAGSKTSRSKAATAAPESLEPNDTDLKAGAEVGLSGEQVAAKSAAMLDHFRSKGEARADWHATLRTWLRNAPKFDAPTSRNGSAHGAPRNGAAPIPPGSASKQMSSWSSFKGRYGGNVGGKDL
jgi:hypothetical protein